MQQKTKAIIIVLGAIIIFGLMVAVIFDLFPKKEQAPSQELSEVAIPQKDDALPENTVFDSSNAQDFAQLDPFASSRENESDLEKEAKDLAQFFIERFGTYSSDANGANIDDLRGFMSDSMLASIDSYKQGLGAQKGRESYFEITTDAASIESKDFSLAKRSAVFSIAANRLESSKGSGSSYIQEAEVSLVQDGSGHWKVDSVIWGKRL